MEESYESIIKKISETYDRRGYGRLWDELSKFMGELSSIKREIITQIVDKEFLSKRNGNADTRIFGEFLDSDIKSLAKRCEQLENG